MDRFKVEKITVSYRIPFKRLTIKTIFIQKILVYFTPKNDFIDSKNLKQ
jgi:hypothetical protein